MRDIIGYVVFTDLKGFSKMKDPETFYEHTIRPLAKNLRNYKYKAEVWNTWGDALVAVFKKGIDAVELMIEYRDYFRKNKLLSLQPRIAGHFGQMLLYNDPLINNMDNVLGDSINKAARIEPITFPGEIYVSKEFKQSFLEEMDEASDSDKERYSQIRFTDLKKWTLPKNSGKMHLFRLFHESEESWNINSLFVKEENENIDHLFQLLDIGKKVQEARKHKDILHAKRLNSEEEIQKFLSQVFEKEKIYNEEQGQKTTKVDGPLSIALAEVYRDIGDYEKALDKIKDAQKWEMEMALESGGGKKKNTYWTSSLEGVSLFPFAENVFTLKLKADILSKQGKFPEAKKILIKILQQNPNDTDALNKLGAQLKREAFELNESKLEERKDLLQEALYLYLEAFRRERDYYPAINAAYIEKILGRSNGWHLASYIFNTWKHETGKDWWTDSTLAETQLLLGEFQFCYHRMERAVTKHNPAFFERHATRDQIKRFIEIFKKSKNDMSLSEEEMQYAALLSILLHNPKLIKDYKDRILPPKKDEDQGENQAKIKENEQKYRNVNKNELYKIVIADKEEMEEMIEEVFKEQETNLVAAEAH